MLRTHLSKRRLLVGTATAVVALLSLSGCYRIDMALTIHDDDTIDGTAILAIDKSVLSMTGSTVDDVFTDSQMGDGTKSEPYTEGDLVGKKYTFEHESLDEFNKGQSNEDNSGQLTVKHVGDTYVVDGTLDMSDGQGSSDESGIDMSGAVASGKVKIAFTFPGKVVDANGQIDPKTNTVTWAPDDPTKPLQMHAVAKDSAGSAIAPWMFAAAGGLLLLVVAGVVVLVVTRSRRRGEPVAPAEAYTHAASQAFYPVPVQPVPPAPNAPAPPHTQQP